MATLGGSPMNRDSTEYERRKRAAMEAIRSAFGRTEDEYGGTLFVSHHLEHLDGNYWLKQLGSDRPEPNRILDLLEIQSDPEDGLETLDFSLPESVTNYVICVTFDSDGKVEDISMES
jgi:hypothetical protein